MKNLKEEIKMNVTKEGVIIFDTTTNLSEPSNFIGLHGLGYEYCSNRELLYLFPRSKVGSNPLRWMSVSKDDIKKLTDLLNSIL